MFQAEHTLGSLSYVKSGQGPKAIQPQAVYYRMLQAEYSLRSVSYLKQAWDIYSSVLTLSAVGGGIKRPPWGKTAILTPKSNDIELKKFDFS